MILFFQTRDKALVAIGITAGIAMLLEVGWNSIYDHIDEAVRLQMADELRGHPVYQKYRSMYPNSTESWGAAQSSGDYKADRRGWINTV